MIGFGEFKRITCRTAENAPNLYEVKNYEKYKSFNCFDGFRIDFGADVCCGASGRNEVGREIRLLSRKRSLKPK